MQTLSWRQVAAGAAVVFCVMGCDGGGISQERVADEPMFALGQDGQCYELEYDVEEDAWFYVPVTSGCEGMKRIHPSRTIVR